MEETMARSEPTRTSTNPRRQRCLLPQGKSTPVSTQYLAPARFETRGKDMFQPGRTAHRTSTRRQRRTIVGGGLAKTWRMNIFRPSVLMKARAARWNKWTFYQALAHSEMQTKGMFALDQSLIKNGMLSLESAAGIHWWDPWCWTPASVLSELQTICQFLPGHYVRLTKNWEPSVCSNSSSSRRQRVNSW